MHKTYKHPPSAEEARYHRAVFDVLNITSLLDLNLGFCIAVIEKPGESRSAYSRLSAMSCADKIQHLGMLVCESDSFPSYRSWAKRADTVRAIRNSFAHGVWEYLPLHPDAPIGLETPPWFSDHRPERFSIDEIESTAVEVHEYFTSFMSWREENGV